MAGPTDPAPPILRRIYAVATYNITTCDNGAHMMDF